MLQSNGVHLAESGQARLILGDTDTVDWVWPTHVTRKLNPACTCEMSSSKGIKSYRLIDVTFYITCIFTQEPD